MGKHVVSSLTRPNVYTECVTQAGVSTVVRSVSVNGGAGIANRQFVTPDGVRTPISNEDADFLSKHKLFQEHQERGFVKIINIDRDPNSVAQSMSKDDGSRPKTEKDVAKYSEDLKKKASDPAAGIQVATNKGK